MTPTDPTDPWTPSADGSLPLIDGTYEVERIIGRGGMGVVVLAHDSRLRRDVAIKVIAESLADRKNVQEQFVIEAQAMARVRHENVVQIFTIGEHDQRPYFVMEYVPGQNLAEWMFDLGTDSLPIDIALGVMEQAARGLDAIHEAGNVHGDVKPGNILIGPDHRVALTDFGLVRSRGALDDTGLIVGTPSFLAPELLDAQNRIDGRADIYSLGVMTYEMLTGHLPLPIETLAEFFAVHRSGRAPISLLESRPDLSERIERVILKALAPNPEHRYATAGEFAAALQAARHAMRRVTPGFRVLIADDDPAFCELAAAVLEDDFVGCEIFSCGTGSDALEYLEIMSADLAVLDLQLPDMSGVDLVRAIRARPELDRVPLLVVTASGTAEDWRTLQDIGASAFLPKPIDPEAFLMVARRAIGD